MVILGAEEKINYFNSSDDNLTSNIRTFTLSIPSSSEVKYIIK